MTVTDKLNVAESYTVSYTYDKVGNRLTQEKEMASGADTETTAYEYNSLNQLLSSKTTNSEGTVTEQKNYLYDANGSQTKETDSISNTMIESSYDLAGRLAYYKKTEKNTVTVTQTNQYNGAGARIQKTEGEEVTDYFYSQGSVLYTEDGTGAGTSLNLSGISGNIIATAREEAGTEAYYYYHKDAAGSTTNLRNAAGESIVSYKYTDFGGTTIGGNEDFYNEICYNGGVHDKSTGLYYLNARYYDPSEGRFISRDSYRGNLSNPSTLQLYAYCANNPVTYSDPSGHVAISRIIGGIVGGGVGAYVGSKIAKKTKATGWKKVAIIAGCTIAGAVVGAIAGPKVAKVAKKAAKIVKKKVKSVAKKLKSTKKTAKKPKVSSTKKVSKTQKTIAKPKNQVTSKKSVKTISNKSIEQKPKVEVKKYTPSEKTKVINHGETKASTQVKVKDVTQMWDDYLGKNQTNIHPRKGNIDPDRIFSADGIRSVRFGKHKMNSMGTSKFHFHFETWDYDAIQDVMNYKNTLYRIVE